MTTDLQVYLSPAMYRARCIAAAKLGLTFEDYSRLRAMHRKWCPACGKWLPDADFARCRSKGDGLQSLCRACFARRAREYRKRKRNDERAD